MGSFSIWHWLIVLLIVVMVFGTKKLKNMGSDLGSTAVPPVPGQVSNQPGVDKTTIDVEAKQKS